MSNRDDSHRREDVAAADIGERGDDQHGGELSFVRLEWGEPAPETNIADVMNGLSLGGGRRRRHRKSEVDEPVAVEPEWPPGESGEGENQVDHAPVDLEPAADASMVRPYAWTRGRTRSTFELRVETMVSAKESDASVFAESEHREIGALCKQPRSVAEVATLFGAPLGVAKVLLGDMAQLGLVTVHKTASGGANKAHLVLMERVLSGLRRL
ncbi:multi-component regulatory system-6 [Alloactinosynnema sp. L-07]|uniref:DUF742 domain-containing protein n=1 Tax=Alloactinosynnema sp. L-07 TaxID=1653480 RepID=UPI00065EF7A3|nr:DUF742 domain-containing protein [Alloactinosynnema sp. L-07]CRK58333.1 multi-component regulatory system-6 [Alloactinosynnema sp. L-07]